MLTTDDPDPRLPPLVEVVDCDAPHDLEVVANLPGSVPDPDAACVAAAAAVGVPSSEVPVPLLWPFSVSPVDFAVSSFVVDAASVECAVSTPPVSGSMVREGFSALRTLPR